MKDNEAYKEIREKALEVILSFKPSEKIDKKTTDEILKLKTDLRKTILLLPDREREVLELKYLENLSYDEISKRLKKEKKEVYDIVHSGIDLVNKTLKVNLIKATAPVMDKPVEQKAKPQPQVQKTPQTQTPPKGVMVLAGIISIALIGGFFFGIWFVFQNLILKNIPVISNYASSAYTLVSDKASDVFKSTKNKVTKMKTVKSHSGKAEIDTIKISGSSSLTNLSNKFVNAYKLDNPNLKFSIISSNSNAGINSLINGKSDIATSSRPLSFSDQKKARNQGVELVESRIAIDALVFIVNSKNPVSDIDVSTLGKIFSGEIKNWNSISSLDNVITPFARGKGSGTNDFVVSRILEGQDFSESIQNKENTKDIIEGVSLDIGAIGFLNSSSYPFGNENVKFLKIRNYEGANSVSPFVGESLNEKALRYGDYPLAHYLYLITSSETKDDANAFLNWVLGLDGQEIVKSSGLISIIEGEE